MRAILQENGGAWSVTKYLTLYQIMQPMAEAPVCYQDNTISPRLDLGMCDTLTLDQWAWGLLQGLATLG